MWNRLTAAALAFAATLVVAPPASAVDPVLANPNPAISAPSGIFRDPGNALWAADGHLGICKLAESNVGAPEPIPSPYCGLPHGGPVAAGQTAFDPATSNIYVGDLASASGGVWRMKLIQSPGVGWEIDPTGVDVVKILDFSAPLVADRVFGMSYYGSQKWLDFSTKNSTIIQRLTDPAMCPAFTTPVTACQLDVVPAGSAEDKATGSLAHDNNGNLYIADLSGVTKITRSNGAGSDTQARPVPGLNLGLYTALAYDSQNKRLYAGTTNDVGVDWIDVLQELGGNQTGTATYSVGFDGVTAIGVDSSSAPNGRLDVVDDTCVKQVCEDVGRGRRFTVPFEIFAPAPRIIDAPQPVANVRVATFVYTYGSPTSFFCSLDLAPAAPCGTGTQGSIEYAGLASGPHSFVLYAGDPVSGPRTIRRFAIDTRAPVVSIDTTTITDTSVAFALSADDINADFTCRMDGGLATPCDSPARYSGLADGLHTFAVHATDFVGNVGAPVSTTFRIGTPPPPPWKAGRVTATLRGTSLRVVFNAPPGATFARFVLSKTSGIKVRSKTVRIKGGVKNTVTIKLTRGEAMRLQRQTVTLRINAGAGRNALTTKAGNGTLKVVVRLTTRGTR